MKDAGKVDTGKEDPGKGMRVMCKGGRLFDHFKA